MCAFGSFCAAEATNASVFRSPGNFVKIENDWNVPVPDNLLPLQDGKNGVESLTEDELLLASPVLYGFSLSDKLWRT